MAELLIELLSEEIPARMQARAADDLKKLVLEGLKERGLTTGSARAYATPRRLTLVIDGVPAKSPDISEERKGPRVGAPEQAIQGFLRSAGVASISPTPSAPGTAGSAERTSSRAGSGSGRYASTSKRGLRHSRDKPRPTSGRTRHCSASCRAASARRCEPRAPSAPWPSSSTATGSAG